MAQQLYFSRDSKMYVEFDSKLWEVPVLDGFSFSQSTNQSEISLSEMQGADGLSRRGNRVFTDSLAPAEWSFSTYARPYSSNSEMGGVEEVLWAVMAGADKYQDANTGGSAATVSTAASSLQGAVAGTYTINAETAGLTYGGNGTNDADGTEEGWEFDVIVTSATAVNTSGTVVVSGGAGWAANNTLTIPAAAFGGTSGSVVITISTVDTTGASFYRLSQADTNSTFGPTVIEPEATKSTINFGQSNRATLGECNIYFVMETSTTIPMIYKLENAAVNEASIDFEVDGIATINWSGFAKNIVDMTSSADSAAASKKAYIINSAGSGSPATLSGTAAVTAAKALTDFAGVTNGRATDPAAGSIIFNRGLQNQLYLVTSGTDSTQARDTGVAATTTFIRNRLTQLLVKTTDTSAFPNSSISGGVGSYSLTLTGGNISISNNISYLVPEELGAVNIPIEHVTGGRTVTGNFTCYLTFDDVGAGSSVDLFNDMTASGAGLGLEKVVNDFEVEFQIGGSTGTPRLNVKMPKVHINVPSHSIEDVISVETNFASYTDEFNIANEVQLEYIGPAV